jgi:endonuclease G, mitochondrial
MAAEAPVASRTRDTFRATVAASAEDRARVRAMVAAGQWSRAEPVDDRAGAYFSRIFARGGKEALQGRTNDLLPISFMTEGAAVRRAVGRVVVDTDQEHIEGSGFLISPHLFLTNQHVITDEAAARRTIVIFDDEADDRGVRQLTTRFRLNPDSLQCYSPEVGGLDYALVAIGERVDGPNDLANLGYCPLANTPDRHMIGMPVNIIQHPGGLPKQIAIRNNLLSFRTEHTLLYETDTDVGSSGSPVFNDDWDVVALHHYGEPFTERRDEHGQPLPSNVNEGIRISAVYNDLSQRAAGLPDPQRALLAEALALWTQAMAGAGLPQLEKRPPTADESLSTRKESTMAIAGDARELKLAVPVGGMPVDVHIRIGTEQLAVGGPDDAAVDAGRAAMSRRPATLAPPQLRRAAEAKRLDKDYSNRNGFNEHLVQGLPVSLSKILAPVAKRIAPLVAGPKSGELKYQNFSVFMDARRDFAILTATNIDGDSYLEVDRKTGNVTDGEEGETWYKDRRILEEYYVGQDFYSAWSHKFDRGHLTRRSDPTWGSTEEAERANADTYHFTNCTPQHFRFNESAKFWQGIERYVLEKGVLQPGRAKQMAVLQGPVLGRDDTWAGDVQVPAAFWKIVLWNGANGKRAVGMLAYQSDLLHEDRVSLGPPRDDQPIEVRQYHTPLSEIAKLTNVDLSDFLAIDTAGKGLPGAGEAAMRITKWSDVTL